MTNFEMMRDRLHAQAGIREKKPPHAGKSFEKMLADVWFPEVIEMAQRRMVMGFLRYGGFNRAFAPMEYAWNAVDRIVRYVRDGNLEHLVDALNMCGIEFKTSRHPRKHFRAQDRDV